MQPRNSAAPMAGARVLTPSAATAASMRPARPARSISAAQAGRPGLLDDPELRWITETPRDCLDAALRDLDKAFDAFFAGRAGFPSFRSVERNSNLSFRAWCRKIVAGRSVSTPPSFSARTASLSRNSAASAIGATASSMAIRRPSKSSREASGSIFILTCAQPDREIDHQGEAVGVDLGVAMPIALSTGEHVTRDPGLAALDQRARAGARKLSRMKRDRSAVSAEAPRPRSVASSPAAGRAVPIASQPN